MQEYVTIAEMVEMCHEAGMKDMTAQRIWYKLSKKVLEGIRPPKENPRQGWRIDKKSAEDFIASHRVDLDDVRTEIQRLQEENRVLLEQMNERVTAHDDHATVPDIEMLISEEVKRLGIHYQGLIDSVKENLQDIIEACEAGDIDFIVRRLIRLTFEQEISRLFEDQVKELPANPFLELSVLELIEKWKKLRRFYGGSPTSGEAALEYKWIEQALRAKGLPIVK